MRATDARDDSEPNSECSSRAMPGCALADAGGVADEPEDSPAPTCTDGDTRECVGPGACAGGQFCERETWSACDCGSPGGENGSSVQPSPSPDIAPASPSVPAPTAPEPSSSRPPGLGEGGSAGIPDDPESVPAGGQGGSVLPTDAGPPTTPSSAPDGGLPPPIPADWFSVPLVPDENGMVLSETVDIVGAWTFRTNDGRNVSNVAIGDQMVANRADGAYPIALPSVGSPICVSGMLENIGTYEPIHLELTLNTPTRDGARGEYDAEANRVVGFAYESSASGWGWSGVLDGTPWSEFWLINADFSSYRYLSFDSSPPNDTIIASWLLPADAPRERVTLSEDWDPRALTAALIVVPTEDFEGDSFQVCISNFRALIAP